MSVMNVTLLAYRRAAVRRAAAIDISPAGLTAANPQHAATAAQDTIRYEMLF